MKRKFRIKKLLMKLIFSCCVLATPNFLQADWAPEECLIDLEPSEFDCLNNTNFKNLKDAVVMTLKGSWCSEEKINLLMDLVYITRPQVCVEIGAFSGSSVLPVAATLKELRHGMIYAIDAWSNEVAIKNLGETDPNKDWWSKVNMNEVQKIYGKMVKTWHVSSFCKTIEETSENAFPFLPEIDFLHIDGDYSEIGSCKDVQLYLPKVKSGGYILISNLFIIVNGEQPKLKAFCALFDSCEIISEIDLDNTVLFQKL